jgi:hypothetical protein
LESICEKAWIEQESISFGFDLQSSDSGKDLPATSSFQKPLTYIAICFIIGRLPNSCNFKDFTQLVLH